MAAQEMLAGARSPAGRKLSILIPTFEKVGRIATPDYNHWKDAGAILAEILQSRPNLKINIDLDDRLLAGA